MKAPVPALLLVLSLAGCASDPQPAREPDWAGIETDLASDSRKDRGQAIERMFQAENDRPGTFLRLACMPSVESPALRHYTAAFVLLRLRQEDPGPKSPLWMLPRGVLELLVTGLDDERSLPVGGAADWDLPIARFCLTALETLTGSPSPPRPVNLIPSKAAIGKWRQWWEQNQRFLCFDAERGVWTADEAARRLNIPVGGP